jgi:hypothetical protein
VREKCRVLPPGSPMGEGPGVALEKFRGPPLGGVSRTGSMDLEKFRSVSHGEGGVELEKLSGSLS